jgi:hypothetical protein
LAVSLLLFTYWFRYTCLLILGGQSSRDFAARIAEANHLSFQQVRSVLAEASNLDNLDALRASLDRDYSVISYLLRHGAGFQSVSSGMERTMLRVDYRMMEVWYAFARAFHLDQSVKALREMAQILDYLAGEMGQRIAASHRA